MSLLFVVGENPNVTIVSNPDGAVTSGEHRMLFGCCVLQDSAPATDDGRVLLALLKGRGYQVIRAERLQLSQDHAALFTQAGQELRPQDLLCLLAGVYGLGWFRGQSLFARMVETFSLDGGTIPNEEWQTEILRKLGNPWAGLMILIHDTGKAPLTRKWGDQI